MGHPEFASVRASAVPWGLLYATMVRQSRPERSREDEAMRQKSETHNRDCSLIQGTQNRRQWLSNSLLGAGSIALSGLPFRTNLEAAELSPEVLSSYSAFNVKSVDRRTVKLQYRPVTRRAMDRELPHWRYTEICSVELENGTVGHGETLLFYTWGVPSDEAVGSCLGKNAAALMWSDSLGAGLQMAMFDAVAKSLGVPVHRLLGQQCHSKTPLSWWNIDMPPADMASECATALKQGYLSYKTKGRPWYDLWAQLEQSTKVVPDHFKIDMDFNDTLLDAERAIPILKELESYPQVDIYESPIPQGDVPGNRAICDATKVNIAMHYGTPDPDVVVREGACDGFVVGGGAQRVMQAGQFAGEVNMPFWLQLVGSGLTAAYSLHFGAVLKQATWPAVNCHQLYAHDLLADSLKVIDGHVAVPETPGIGYEIDWDEVARREVPRPLKRPEPRRLLQVSWTDGRIMDIASDGEVNFVLRLAMQGKMPFFERGVSTSVVADDGTAKWQERYLRAQTPQVRK